MLIFLQDKVLWLFVFHEQFLYYLELVYRNPNIVVCGESQGNHFSLSLAGIDADDITILGRWDISVLNFSV